jgi:hypothetical protein
MAAGATEAGATAVRALLSALAMAMAVAGAIGIRTDAADGEQNEGPSHGWGLLAHPQSN